LKYRVVGTPRNRNPNKTRGVSGVGNQIASSYCIRKGLIRKAHLAHNLKKWNAKHPGGRLVRAVPETLVMVLDDIEYFEEALSDVYEVFSVITSHRSALNP
jgi:hypothetical protein